MRTSYTGSAYTTINFIEDLNDTAVCAAVVLCRIMRLWHTPGDSRWAWIRANFGRRFGLQERLPGPYNPKWRNVNP